MAADSKAETESLPHAFQIDETYEFSAPRFFDFINDETEEEKRMAELWFETALSYAPSPFMQKIKAGRSVKLDSLCDFGDSEQILKAAELFPSTTCNPRKDATLAPEDTRYFSESVVRTETRMGEIHQQQEKDTTSPVKSVIPNPPQISSAPKPCEDSSGTQVNGSILPENSSIVKSVESNKETTTSSLVVTANSASRVIGIQECTPKAQMISKKGVPMPNSSKNETAKKLASLIKKKSALKPKNHSLPSEDKTLKPASVRRCPGSISAKTKGTTDIAIENQAIKRQKLDEGRSRQILNVKNRILPHKTKQGLIAGSSDLALSAIKGRREGRNDLSQRKVYVREPAAAPFISMAEMVRKFQSNTRELELPHNKSLSHDVGSIASMVQRRPKLTLTRPKEPELETSHRSRPAKVKSTAELEEEMLANIPKFKARPVNKKILEATSLPALPRSTPQPPEFQEFHLKTMERAYHHAGTSSASVSSFVDSSCQNQGKFHRLTEPKTPLLETSLRARPPKIKSSQELEQEELEKMPKFKARPLNKKIFDSRGDLGVFCHPKRQLTIPQEFHFATNYRIPPPPVVVDLFDKVLKSKLFFLNGFEWLWYCALLIYLWYRSFLIFLQLSLNSEPHQEHQKLPRITQPSPFHLHTEERGMEKERRLAQELLQKQIEEERARIPKANPYPYTTDYPVIPPKPEPKECTRPEAFQLESLARHEEEMQRKMEERERMERDEAQMRIFRAQPILKEDPLPVPEKSRKPLTEVQEFALHVDHRAIDRAEFDIKVKEKEMMYKRYREEHESAKLMEEEKAVKQMRRTMVPHARPIPNFANPFLPQKSLKETTKPKSPNLHLVQRYYSRRGRTTATGTCMR
ncbi:targeting protein for XKLP2 isoform X2 [Tasmannia lanceolata]|uniref:targeting protein for XKLP2 isoform X2 n=1 Tax=Tasmannia lanceolata TaxID=3420 RepID=UPI004062D885